MEWIPRAKNELAEYISKMQYYDDWMIDPSVFTFLDIIINYYVGALTQSIVSHQNAVISYLDTIADFCA